jgi:hypothetical protein
MDELSSLRIYGRIDEVMLHLMYEMKIPFLSSPYSLKVPETALAAHEHIYLVPYRQRDGYPTRDGSKQPWDLRLGTQVKCTAGPGKGFLGSIVRLPKNVSSEKENNLKKRKIVNDECDLKAELIEYYTVLMPNNREGSDDFGSAMKRYPLGLWWIDAALRGTIPQLPIINVV